jgi:hypothetical protein
MIDKKRINQNETRWFTRDSNPKNNEKKRKRGKVARETSPLLATLFSWII